MVGRQLVRFRAAAVRPQRGTTVVELMVVAAVLGVLAALLVVPAYSQYARARETSDAAAILAQDISYLERYAQDSAPFEGATLEVQSFDPLTYTAYAGRPSWLDAAWRIRGIIFKRTFSNVALNSRAWNGKSPLLFARNGSVQYVNAGGWADQHVTLTIVLSSRLDPTRTASVDLNPFTGAVATLSI